MDKFQDQTMLANEINQEFLKNYTAKDGKKIEIPEGSFEILEIFTNVAHSHLTKNEKIEAFNKKHRIMDKEDILKSKEILNKIWEERLSGYEELKIVDERNKKNQD